MSPRAAGSEYQLRGEIEGRGQRLRLAPGVNRFGSLPDNDVVLAASGVSRRHVEIDVGARHLVLVDLGSKNGTFVNGRRARRAHLKAGDEIGIGELKLRLERLEGDDAVLGLELGRAAAPATAAGRSFTGRETTRLAQDLGVEVVGPWLELVDGFVDDLLAGRGERLTGALWRIAQALDVGVCCVVEQAPGAEAGIVAAAGAADGPDVEAGMEAFLAAAAERPAAGRSPAARGFHAGGERPVTGSVMTVAGRPALGLLVVGPVVARAEIERLLATLLRLLAHLRFETPAAESAGGPHAPGLRWPRGYVPGTSAAMSALHDQVRAVAPAGAPVLILGETGVGKELVARMLHDSSPRHAQAFVALNCAAIPADLLEAELFGVEKGAASGVARRPGIFRRADRGTLFLDEIGDMPSELQVKLLRALQEKEIQPVGGTPLPVDARVVSATNLDLRDRVAGGRFRADLYYRLAGYTLLVPPLRQRTEDLPGLIEHFLRDACVQLGKILSGVTLKALNALNAYPWPGNVRELEHEVRRLATLCREAQAIDFELLSEPVRTGLPGIAAAGSAATETPVTPAAAISEDDGRFHLASHEKRLIRQALEAAGGQLTAAARRLGISRDALRRRLSRHGLRVEGRR